MAKFVVIVSMLVHFGIIFSSQTPDIIRGESDKFSKDYHRGENESCSDAGYCTCPKNNNTFIYDSRKSPPGKCVKDQNINNEDLSGGKFFAEGDKCRGVSEHGEIKTLTCNISDASVLWLWIRGGYMLNLRTLKCLELYNKKKLILKQCRKHERKQYWQLTVRNYKKEWLRLSNHDDDNDDVDDDDDDLPYGIYKGCYRFSDGRFMHLVDTSGCGTSCSLDLSIRAPIMFNGEYKCVLDKNMSKYSIDGQKWTTLIKSNLEGVSVDNKSREEITLKIQNKSLLLEKLPGRLLKLEIKCGSIHVEHHCILLKIEGATKKDSMVTDKIPFPPRSHSGSPVTSYRFPTTNVPGKSSTFSPDINKESQDGNKDTSKLIAIVVLFCLLLALIATALHLHHRRRQRLMNIIKENNTRLETIPRSDSPRQNSTQPEQSFEFPDDDIYIDVIQRDEIPTPDYVNNHDYSNQTVVGSPVYHTPERSNEAVNNEESVYTELDEALRSPEPVYNMLVS